MAVALAGLILLSSAASATAAGAETIAGAARVIDGDTLDVAGTRVRLEGIDAPETGQSCGRKWLGSFDCGAAATRQLEELTRAGDVVCAARGRDRYGRLLGVCTAGGVEINAEMVRRGMAWAFLKYSRAYEHVEAEARAMRIGIWAGDAEPAWVYRARAWQSAGQAAPRGCAIKGNVSRHGQIYHLPWSPWYGRVTIDERRGERWFCSEDEAVAAGWRPAGG